jgi:pimeloyl-ACP methyl ester carboxylesterase
MNKKHMHLSDIRGVSQLAIDATLGINDLVRVMHHNILKLPAPLAAVAVEPEPGLHGTAYTVLQKTSGVVYSSIQIIASLIGGGLDSALRHLLPELAEIKSTRERAVILSVVNGVLGDHLTTKNNPLSIGMGFYQNGEAVPLTQEALISRMPEAKGKILVMLHGHCMNELQWDSNGHNHGETLAGANDFSLMTLRYNTGLHISQNGRQLAQQLEQLVRAWPVPVQEVCIVGYSMGGLIARSAFYYGAQAGHAWMAQVRKLMFVGTPHHGSMVERAGNMIDKVLDASPYSSALSRLGKIRSAGTTDLRHGNLLDTDWEGQDRFANPSDVRTPVPLPAHVQCYAIAAMISKEHGELRGRLIGDGLVPLQSALGQHDDAQRALNIPMERTTVLYSTNHLGLLASKAACEQLQLWIAQ